MAVYGPVRHQKNIMNRNVFLLGSRISYSKVRNWNYRVNTKFKDLNLNQYYNIECILKGHYLPKSYIFATHKN
jgi:hypothetical protein